MNDNERPDNRQTLLAQPENGIYKASDVFLSRVCHFEDHTRQSKVHPDARARLEIVGSPRSPNLLISASESFEMSNGNTRTHEVSLSLSQKNIDALRVYLNVLHSARTEASS